MLKKVLLLIVVMLSFDAYARSGPVPLMDPPPVTVPPAVNATTVEKAILSAGLSRNWTIVDKKPGWVTLQYAARGFSVTVKVSYDSNNVSIHYADSSDLEYSVEDGTPVIHRNYNRWVNNLAHDISRELSLGAPK